MIIALKLECYLLFLNEMDGVDGNDNNKMQVNALALGATNRPNVLDLALL